MTSVLTFGHAKVNGLDNLVKFPLGKGPFKCYVTLMGVGQIFRKKRYEGVMFNVISVTRGWVGVQFPKK